ncbi:phosphatidylserine decarboxylase [bacterium I07]|nr:phosphatidylserine decarboxylase [bacterium I07]
MINLRIVKEGFPFLKRSAIFSVVMMLICIIWVKIWLFAVFCISIFWLLFILFFFRDPQRSIPESDQIIVSPADGRIMRIDRSGQGLLSGMVNISIFLSLWDVHINRIPVSGQVIFVKHIAGRYFPAFQSRSWGVNEQVHIGLQSNGYQVFVKQIAGTIARRIVCDLKAGEKAIKGERFGMIKFGSCVELTIPGNTELRVTKGDRVKAGETVIGSIANET